MTDTTTTEITETEVVKHPTYWLSGGLGKHVMFTALIRDLVKASETNKINILSAYPDIFEHHPDVADSWSFDTEKEVIGATTTTIKNYEPYHGTYSVKHFLHLLKDWGDGMGITYTGGLPVVNVPEHVKEMVDEKLEELGDFIIIQLSGGQPPVGYNPDNPYGGSQLQQQRNYPYAMGRHFVMNFKKEHPDINIVDFTLPNESPGYPEAIRFELPYIAYVELLKHAITFIGIDSCLHHMAAGVDKPGVVIWGGTSVSKLGWDMHENVSNYDQETLFDENDPFYIAVDYIHLVDLVDKVMSK